MGAGLVGLLTALCARHHGAHPLVVVDPTEQRRRVAEALGLPTLDAEAEDPAAVLETLWHHGPGDCGADVVFQCRGQTASLALALRLLRPQGAVIDLAFYQAGADEVHLGEEFHHNGLTVRCAQIGRVPRGLGHLWDRQRLSAETLRLLRADGDAILAHLMTSYPLPMHLRCWQILPNAAATRSRSCSPSTAKHEWHGSADTGVAILGLPEAGGRSGTDSGRAPAVQRRAEWCSCANLRKATNADSNTAVPTTTCSTSSARSPCDGS